MTRQFLFPAVLYFDEENDKYSVAFYDLDIFTEGNTVEEAFKSAKDFLYTYVKCSFHINGEIEKATSYIVVKNEYKSEIVLLVDTENDENDNQGFVEDLFE